MPKLVSYCERMQDVLDSLRDAREQNPSDQDWSEGDRLWLAEVEAELVASCRGLMREVNQWRGRLREGDR